MTPDPAEPAAVRPAADVCWPGARVSMLSIIAAGPTGVADIRRRLTRRARSEVNHF